MADKTGIQWTDATWNPFVGCSLVSPACTNCYAMAQAHRIQRMTPGSHYEGTTKVVNGKPVWTGVLKHAPEHILLAPLRWTKPRKIFVNSMSDLFHESVPNEWIDRVFAIMALAPQHTFQVLTKRPQRMREYLSKDVAWRNRQIVVARNGLVGVRVDFGEMPTILPLPNVWLGVTAEDQQRADERIPDLLATPAAVRFVSVEPMLGELRLDQIKVIDEGEEDTINALTGEQFSNRTGCQVAEHRALDWVICGGESGPDARALHPEWARSLRDQCAAAGVPFFFKQHGEWIGVPDLRNLAGGSGPGFGAYDHYQYNMEAEAVRVGKRRAGRLLDGREHNEFPEVRNV